jgi:hypothetical protein
MFLDLMLVLLDLFKESLKLISKVLFLIGQGDNQVLLFPHLIGVVVLELLLLSD